MTFSDFIKTRFATWVLTGALVLVCFIAVKILIQKHQIDSQIAKLQAQADKIKQDNDKISSLINYFNTQEYTEKQARQQLNLKKDGEDVVALPADNGAAQNA